MFIYLAYIQMRNMFCAFTLKICGIDDDDDDDII